MARKASIFVIAVAAIVLAAAAYFNAGGHNAPANQAPLANLTTQSLEGFRADFNRAADRVRLVLLLSPT